LSPDGKQLAVARSADGQTSNIWIKQLDRGPSIKLTVEGSVNSTPTWTPDGRSITFTSNAAHAFDLWTRPSDGSAKAELLLHQKRALFQPHWSPDGRWLTFQTHPFDPGFGDILGIRSGTDKRPVPLVATMASELSPVISPNGRWLAYVSNESGENEVYVVPFPNASVAKWAVSAHGGREPRWSHSGNELFYEDAEGNLVSVAVKTSPTFSIGRSRALFPAAEFFSFELHRQYAVAADDRRFLMIRPAGAIAPDKVIVVDNWFEELKTKTRK
jgi:Tol biopolymer transport system component